MSKASNTALAAPEAINKSNLVDLKNTSDDAIAPFMSGLGYTQSHYLTDIRLAIGYLAAAIIALTAFNDYKKGFTPAKSHTLIGVVLYFVLNTVLTLWMFFVEKGTVYVGSDHTKGKNIKVESLGPKRKWEPRYRLKVVKLEDMEKDLEVEVEGEFGEWFDEDGVLVRKNFDEFLAGALAQLEKKKL
ncbi:hypothetical protein YB2330_005076 [Saitoella coloradoensis]